MQLPLQAVAVGAAFVIPYFRNLIHLTAYLALSYLVVTHVSAFLSETDRELIKSAAGVIWKGFSRASASAVRNLQAHWGNFTWET